MNYSTGAVHRKQTIILVFVIGVLGSLACGYRMRSAVGMLPDDIRSLGIPAFENKTNDYKVEQILTDAVLKEFNRRTRARVLSANTGVDAVLQGEITGIQSSPVTFGSRSFGSAYEVRVTASVRLVRSDNSKVIWQDKNFTFRERYTLNRDVNDFFNEENPALERLANSFATSLVSVILESQSIDSSKL